MQPHTSYPAQLHPDTHPLNDFSLQTFPAVFDLQDTHPATSLHFSNQSPKRNNKSDKTSDKYKLKEEQKATDWYKKQTILHKPTLEDFTLFLLINYARKSCNLKEFNPKLVVPPQQRERNSGGTTSSAVALNLGEILDSQSFFHNCNQLQP